jgi:O-antigen ligase
LTPQGLRFESRIEAAVFAGMLALLCWAPLPFASNRAWAVSILDGCVFALFALWLVDRLGRGAGFPPQLRRHRLPLGLAWVWLALIGLQLVPLPAALLGILSPGSAQAYGTAYGGMPPAWAPISVENSATTQYFLLSLALVLYFFLVFAIATNSARVRLLCSTLVLSGTFQAVLGVYLHFTGAEYFLFFERVQHDQLTGSFLNRNHFATYMEICMGLGAGLMVAQFTGERARNWRQRLRQLAQLMLSPKAVIRICLIVMVMALIVTRSRMGNAAVFTAILIAAVVGLGLSRIPRRPLLIFLTSMIVLDIVVIGSWIGVEKVMQRVQETSLTVSDRQDRGGAEESLQERAGPGVGALAAWRDYPLFGSGGKTFYIVYQRYRAPGSKGFFDHAHMDYAEFAADAGLLGFASLALLSALSLKSAIRVLRERSDPLYRGLALGAFMGLVAVGMHLTVEFSLQIPAVAFAFCVLLAVPWLCRKQEWDAPAGQEGTGRSKGSMPAAFKGVGGVTKGSNF